MHILALAVVVPTYIIAVVAGMHWFKSLFFASFFTCGGMFLLAAFLDWMARTHSRSDRLFPTCAGLLLWFICVGLLI